MTKLKYAVLLIVVGFVTSNISAQNKSSVETRALIKCYNSSKSVEKMPKQLVDRYPIRYIKGQPFIGVVAKVDNTFDASKLESDGIKVTSRVASIVSMRAPVDKLQCLEKCKGIISFSVAHRVAPMMDKTREDTRTDSVQAGLGVPMPFNGEGVIIGITDWGFDYTHPNLNKKSNPRILRAWDQFKLSGPAPDGFDYGTEYTTYDELKTAKGDTSGLYNYGTHGTHVAGICGGNGTNDGHVIGQAPKAQFLLGSWYLDEASWLDQVAWMKRVAQDEGKRLVINGSWGMYTFSTLDGTSYVSQAIDAYSDSGIVFVTSGGNNGDCNYHIQHYFGNNDTLRSIATYLSGGIGQALIYWGEPAEEGQQPKGFKVGFSLAKNTDISMIFDSPLFSTDDDIDYLESFVVADNDTIRFDVMTESANPLDGRPHALLNVSRNSGYKLIMKCVADTETVVNIWNVGNVQNHAGNTGCNFENNSTLKCVKGDKYYGIGEPGCSNKTITVAAHSSDYGQHIGGITSFSSYGPTLDGRAKPEISAPGLSVVSSISSWQNVGNYPAVYSAMSNGRNYTWGSMSGTSMSSPAVAGVVALMLQANPNLSVDRIREILFSTARNDMQTGLLHANDSVSVRWGHGKVDALHAVNAAYDLLSVEEASNITPRLVAFPNPTRDNVTVLTGSNKPEQMELFSSDGRKILQQTVSGQATIDISTLPRGVYFLRVHDITGIRTAKVVKN
ncbi:MAG: S8 family peptidase [Bacteroidales bacterium]|nr:S8 family peptidase [Bacteroidales bacterium]